MQQPITGGGRGLGRHAQPPAVGCEAGAKKVRRTQRMRGRKEPHLGLSSQSQILKGCRVPSPSSNHVLAFPPPLFLCHCLCHWSSLSLPQATPSSPLAPGPPPCPLGFCQSIPLPFAASSTSQPKKGPHRAIRAIRAISVRPAVQVVQLSKHQKPSCPIPEPFWPFRAARLI